MYLTQGDIIINGDSLHFILGLLCYLSCVLDIYQSIKLNLGHAWLLEPSALRKLILFGIYQSIKLNIGHALLLGPHALGKLITLFILSIKQNLSFA